MAGGGGNADGDVGFQIAPMIDLILVLMVFFMSTVALKQVERELAINLPGTSLAKTEGAALPMNIGIEPDGSVNLNNQLVGNPGDFDLNKLQEQLKEQVKVFNDKIPVVIMPHPDVPHRRVINVLNACSAAKVKNVSFGG